MRIPRYQFGLPPALLTGIPGLSGAMGAGAAAGAGDAFAGMGPMPNGPSGGPFEKDSRCPDGQHWNDTTQTCLPNMNAKAKDFLSAGYNAANSELMRGGEMFSAFGQAGLGAANAPGWRPDAGLGAAGGFFSGAASGGLLGGLLGAGVGFLKTAENRTQYETLQDLYEKQKISNKTVGANYGYYAQFGGQTPEAAPTQTEFGEVVLFPDNALPDVMADKYHKHMDDDDITDMLPEGSYVFSNDKTMKFNVKDIREELLGVGMSYYSENGNEGAEEMEMGDVLPKSGKITFAEAAKYIRNKIKTTGDRQDLLSIATDSDNLETRVPYLMKLVQMQDEKNMRAGRTEDAQVPMFQMGGRVKRWNNGNYQPTGQSILYWRLPRTSSWVEFPFNQAGVGNARQEALRRGELYQFATPQAADYFARGAYKTPPVAKKQTGGVAGPYDLPGFTVVSTNKPKGSTERNTLEYLDTINEISDPAVLNMWDEFGNPNVQFGVNQWSPDVRAWYNTDGIWMRGPEQGRASMAQVYGNTDFLTHEAKMLMQAYGKLNKSRREGGLGRSLTQAARERQYKADAANAYVGMLPYDFQENLIAELTHAKQHTDKGNLGMVFKGIKSWLKSPFFNRRQQSKQYDIPGSLEYEAHSIIEPELIKRTEVGEPPRVKIDLPDRQYGGAAERAFLLQRKKMQDTFPEPPLDRSTLGPIGEPGARAAQAAAGLAGLQAKKAVQDSAAKYAEFQQFLENEGYEGTSFEDRLKNFQKQHGLMVDGIVGPGAVGVADFIADTGRYLDAIHGVESKGSGNYAALNDSTGAVGRYQFVPGAQFHGANFKDLKDKLKADKKGLVRQEDIIKAYTGVSDMEEFRNSPDAQDKYAKYYGKRVLIPDAVKAKRLSKTKLPLSDMIALVHFQGYKKALELAKNPDAAIINPENNLTVKQYLEKYRKHLGKSKHNFSGAKYGSTWTIVE